MTTAAERLTDSAHDGYPIASRLRWGILATGDISAAMTEDLQTAGHAVTAVGSRDRGKAETFASRFEIPNAHGTYADLVSDPEVDIVYIATPPSFHAEEATRALLSGKHVLVEKPFTLNAREARAVTDLAARLGLVALEAMWTRWLPHMVRIREIVAAGTLGDVRTLMADHDQKLVTDPVHRLNDRALGGGALMDLGVYPVSFAHDVFGSPETVRALSSMSATGVDRQTAIILGFDDGQQAVLHCALDTEGTNTALLIGTEARIEIDSVWFVPTTLRVVAPDGTLMEEFDGRVSGRGMQYQAAEIERLVMSGDLGGTVLPPSESVDIMTTLDLIRDQIGLKFPSDA